MAQMKSLWTLVFMFIAFFGGYFSASHYDAALESQINRELLTASHDDTQSLTYAIEVMTQEFDQRSPGEALDQPGDSPSAVSSALGQLPSSEHEQKLSRALASTGLGEQLNLVLKANRHPGEIPGANLLLPRMIQKLQKDPTQGVNEVAQAIDSLSDPEFAAEQASLFLLVNEALAPSAAVKELALSSLVQNTVPPRVEPDGQMTQEQLDLALSTAALTNLPAIEHQVFLNNTQNQAEALRGTVQGILAQPDSGIRTTLASQFLKAHPDLREQLISNIEAGGIPSPIDSAIH